VLPAWTRHVLMASCAGRVFEPRQWGPALNWKNPSRDLWTRIQKPERPRL